MSNLSFGDLEADYVLTEEEKAGLRTEDSLQEIQQNIDAAQQEQLLRDAELQAMREAAEAPAPPQMEQAPTGAVQPQQQAPAPSTESASITGDFDPSKDYSYYAALGMSREEWNRRQLGTGAGGELETFATDPRGSFEMATAIPTGLLDFGADLINKFLPKSLIQVPKITPYENKVAQTVRDISAVVGPTIALQGAGMAAGTAAQSQVGWSLGNTAFMKFLGARGVEAGAAVAVGSISSQYETGDNLMGSIKKTLPAQWDFIPDSWATLDANSPDEKRQKSINEDLALGFLIPFVRSARRFGAAIGEVREVMSPKVVGFTDKAKGWVDEAAPVADDVDDLTKYALNQEDSLDELGAYNLSNNPNMDVALKGVHDLYDWNEIGMRTVDDFGIVGASLDAVRIAKNYDTVYGRLGSVVSPPATKYAVTNPAAAEEITLGLARQLKDADEYGMEAANWSIKFDDVVQQGENLAVELFDPSMGVKELREVLEPFIVKTKEGAEYVAEEGYARLFKAMGVMSEGLSDMDIARTQGYLATSLAGQVSDIAEGVRINRGSISVEGAQERIKENLMFLMKLQGVSRYYANQKRGTKNIFEKMISRGKAPDPVLTSDEDVARIIQSVQDEVNVFGENLDYLRNTSPKTAEALMELYELSDGKINSIFKLNEDIQNTYTRWRPIIDNEPDAPNILVQAVRGNYYNSMLSSFGTGAKALFGNLGGTIAEPVSYFAGAILRTDLDSIQRGWMAYSALWDTQKKALPYAGQLFVKASQNPNSVVDATRRDYIFQVEEKIAAHRKIAQEQEAQGNYGLSYLIDTYENMMHMANDPVFRLIPNTFTGLDGWTNATLANAHARFRAMSELKRLGKEAKPSEIKKLADAEYDSMFGTDGLIVDEAVKYNTAEIALNLDTNMSKSLNELLKVVPAARMFFRFPTTMTNVVKQVDDYMPLPLKSFQQDINDLAYTAKEELFANPELMDRLLSSRGFNPSKMDETMKLDTIIDLKNKTLGKKAIGTFITGTVVTGLFLNKLDITGDGLYDQSAQRSREQNSDWERRTVKIGNKRIKYEDILGPGLASWVAMVVNTADNFDTLGEAYTENTFQKLAFILGGAVTEQAVVSSLRPLVEMAAGNAPQFERFAAGQLNALGPLSGLRNEMGRVLDGGLKIVEDGILAQIANRNQLGGVIDPANRLPYVYNPVSGKVANKYTLLERVFNAYSPIKIYPEQGPEERFLQDIEYDIAATFRTKDGIELNPRERSELFRLMGEQGYFRKKIQSISKTAESRKTIERLREARLSGIDSTKVSLDDFDRIHYQLDVALREAEKLAFAELDSDMRTAIDARILAAKMQTSQAEQGVLPSVQSTMSIRR
jgi:hypothetical protein